MTTYEQARALEDMLSRLPADQREVARANPEAFYGQAVQGRVPSVPHGFQIGRNGFEPISGHIDLLIDKARQQGMQYTPPGMTRGPLGQMIPTPGRIAPISTAPVERPEPVIPPKPITRNVGPVYVNEVRASAYRAARKDRAALKDALRVAGIDGEHDLSTDAGQARAARALSRKLAADFVAPENLSAGDRTFLATLLDRSSRSEDGQAVYDDVLEKVSKRVADRAETFRKRYEQTDEGWERFREEWDSTLESRPLFNDEERAALEAKAPVPDPVIAPVSETE